MQIVSSRVIKSPIWKVNYFYFYRYETALDLARRDARVIIACRDVLRMESAVRTLKHESGNENIIGIELDLTRCG